MCNHHVSKLDGGHPATEDNHGISRRTAVGAAGGTAVALLFAGIRGTPGGAVLDALGPDVAEAATGTCTMTPAKTVGPYFVEEQLNRSDVRTNTSDGAAQAGVPLTLTLQVFDADADCAAVQGATVDIWHANAGGLYSDEAANSTSGQNWLRGYQTTDASGQVTFTTIYPGWYSGRTVHIHFKVRIFDGSTETLEFTSQLFFTDDMNKAVFAANSPYKDRSSVYPDTTDSTDSIYGSDGASLLLSPASDGNGGFTAAFSVGVAQSTSQLNNTSAGTGGGSPTGGGPGGTHTGTTGTTGSISTVSPTTTTVSSTGEKIVSAAITSAKMMRNGLGERRLRVAVRATEAVTVTTTLTRGGKKLAGKTSKLAAGTSATRVAIPASVKAGAASLRITLTDAAGNTKHYTRTISVAARKR